MNIYENTEGSVHPRLHDVACLLASALVRIRKQSEGSERKAVDLDNACELRVYDRTLKPQRRQR